MTDSQCELDLYHYTNLSDLYNTWESSLFLDHGVFVANHAHIQPNLLVHVNCISST